MDEPTTGHRQPEEPDEPQGDFRTPYREWKGTQYGIPFGSPGNTLRREPDRRAPNMTPVVAAVVVVVVLVLGGLLLLI